MNRRWQLSGRLGCEAEGEIFVGLLRRKVLIRNFRKVPPTDDELRKNLAIMNLKKQNAALLKDKNAPIQDHAALKKDETGQKAAFPSYDEYEVMPGKGPKNPKG